MKKQTIPILLSILLCAAVLQVGTQALERTSTNEPELPIEGDVWDGSIVQPATLVNKDGANYYEITKCAELAYVAQTGGHWLNANYILGNNLIFNEEDLKWSETGALAVSPDDLNEWHPIGDGDRSYFSGTFCGNGYLISGIYVGSGSYVGLFSMLDDEGTIEDVTLINSYILGRSYVGGIVGYNGGGRIQDCSYYGCVSSNSGMSGGICGVSTETSFHGNAIVNCANHGAVYSKGDQVGGVVGKSIRDDILMCANYGEIHADGDHVGGVVGLAETFPEISECVNYGAVSGGSYVGGICGQAESETYLVRCIRDCYNAGNVAGADSVGGILGKGLSCKTENCYSLADVEGTTNVGAIVGHTDSLFGKSKEHHNYYLSGSAAVGRGNIADSADEAEKKSETQLKNRTSFISWDFDTVWVISANQNGGFPYFQWQEGILTDVVVSGVELAETRLTLAEGDCAFLDVDVLPRNASNKTVAWSSSDPNVAAVSSAGKVTAISAGTAVITATSKDGDYTAKCSITVLERVPEEYRINGIVVRSGNGEVLQTIPKGTCLATVSVTNLASQGDALVFLAAYTSAGQYQGMLWVGIEDVPVRATIQVTLPVNNSEGNITELKAFTVASFTSLLPLGEMTTLLP